MASREVYASPLLEAAAQAKADLRLMYAVLRARAYAKRRGNCYVASEALYHALGGKKAGWKPMVMRVKTDTHWFLLHKSGLILDPTKSQFRKPLDYSKARGSGFLTKKPSKRAKALMEKLVWQS